jgi:hypothetical protein
VAGFVVFHAVPHVLDDLRQLLSREVDGFDVAALRGLAWLSCGWEWDGLAVHLAGHLSVSDENVPSVFSLKTLPVGAIEAPRRQKLKGSSDDEEQRGDDQRKSSEAHPDSW